jgi:hypothetical protein
MSAVPSPLRREYALLCNERASVPARFHTIEAPPAPSAWARVRGEAGG